MFSSKTKENICKGCGVTLDAATTADGSENVLESGDLSVCANCGVIAKFDDDLSLQPLTIEEIDELQSDIRNQILNISNSIKLRLLLN
jgi:hypothetical protein